MADNTKSKEAVGFARLTGLAYLVVIFCALSWAKDFLLPMVLAMLVRQAVDLINSIPKYRDNIEAKWAAIQKGPSGPLNGAFRNVGELVNDLSKIIASAHGTQEPEPSKVQVVGGADGIAPLVKAGMTPIVGPVGEFAVVVALGVFLVVWGKRV